MWVSSMILVYISKTKDWCNKNNKKPKYFENPSSQYKYTKNLHQLFGFVSNTLRPPSPHLRQQCHYVQVWSCFQTLLVILTGAGKVKSTHGGRTVRGINPEEPRVSVVDPSGRDATKGFFWTQHASKNETALHLWPTPPSRKAPGAKSVPNNQNQFIPSSSGHRKTIKQNVFRQSTPADCSIFKLQQAIRNNLIKAFIMSNNC